MSACNPPTMRMVSSSVCPSVASTLHSGAGSSRRFEVRWQPAPMQERPQAFETSGVVLAAAAVVARVTPTQLETRDLRRLCLSG